MIENKESKVRVAPGRVKTINGSILAPHNAGLRFVLSVNNLAGKMDNNPLYPVFEKKWKKIKEDARGWYATKTGAYKLGAINTTCVQSDVWAIHMLCQDDKQQTSPSALQQCLKEVAKLAKTEQATVHVSCLLTTAVPEMEGLLKSQLVDQGVNVYYYKE